MWFRYQIVIDVQGPERNRLNSVTREQTFQTINAFIKKMLPRIKNVCNWYLCSAVFEADPNEGYKNVRGSLTSVKIPRRAD